MIIGDIVAQYDEYVDKLLETIKSVYQLTTRVEEKSNNIEKKQDSLEKEVRENKDLINNSSLKIAIIESKESEISQIKQDLIDLKKRQKETEDCLLTLTENNKINKNNWKIILNFIIQILIIIIAYYILSEVLRVDIK